MTDAARSPLGEFKSKAIANAALFATSGIHTHESVKRRRSTSALNEFKGQELTTRGNPPTFC